jgi:hypothetical protein
MEKSWKRKNVFPTIFPHIPHPVINDSINSSLPTNSTLRLRSADILLFCFLINKQKGSFLCGEDARHQNAPLCEFVNKAGTGSRQFLPDSPNTAMFYRLVGYIASSQ